MTGIRTEGKLQVSFSLCSEQPMSGIAVEVEQGGKLRRVFEERFDSPEKQPVGRWREFSFSMKNDTRIDKVHWLESDASAGGLNRLYILDVELSGADKDVVLWREDFIGVNWWGEWLDDPHSLPSVVNTESDGRNPRFALQVSPDNNQFGKDIAGLKLDDTQRFRCRLKACGDSPANVMLELISPGRTISHQVQVPVGSWQTIDLSWDELGFSSPKEFQTLRRLGIQARGGQVFLDDVTFRRPASRVYEVMKFVHCAVPTLTAMVAALICLVLLRFEEVRDVVAWVKARGWRRRKEEGEGAIRE
jgi:hypothetical protein